MFTSLTDRAEPEEGNASVLLGLVCVEGYAPVDVELSVVGQVIVDDQGNLRDIQPSSPDICRDQNPTETQNTAVKTTITTWSDSGHAISHTV